MRKTLSIVLGFGLSGICWAQYEGSTAESTKDLPSTKAALPLTDIDSAVPEAKLPAIDPNSTSPIPQPRPPTADPSKAGTKDWGQDMKALQEATKKKQEDMAAVEEQKAKDAKEAQEKQAMEKKEKADLKKENDGRAAPAVSQSSFPGVKSEEIGRAHV
jgi:type IV secretory pathway VirB10-like protein